jgi:hypothetical protein
MSGKIFLELADPTILHSVGRLFELPLSAYIKATYRDGILEVYIPKADEAKRPTRPSPNGSQST